MSCNGCRVLRKGCSDSCALRPCLQWIEGAEAQGHATVFVAKFFGRAGLMGFISAVPDNQRPALFRSLLYEACGRTVNPVYGAVGLLWSGNWHVCQAAVDTVLRGGSLRPAGGAPITNLPCYGPMPNLPRLHMKSTQTTPDCHHQEQDLKRFKSVDRSSLENNGLVSNVKPDSSKLPQQNGFRPLDQARDRTVTVKRERDEAPEIIAPVARRPRVGCRMDHLVAVDEAIDLDLTLSSHPPTPQLFLPRKNAGNSVTRVASPVSCSNSFSSEGSVTSLDTGDFIASKNIPGRNIPGMDLLQAMERR